MIGRREPGVGRAGVEAEAAALAAVHGHGIAARRVGPRGSGGDGEAPGERCAADTEARGGRLPSGHVDRLRRAAAYAAVARWLAEGDGVAAGHEPIERDDACSANGLTSPAGPTDGVA